MRNTIDEIIEAVAKAALTNYDSSPGWQSIAECWTDENMRTLVFEANLYDIQEAIIHFQKVADILTNQEESSKLIGPSPYAET